MTHSWFAENPEFVEPLNDTWFFEIRRGNLTSIQELIHQGYNHNATHFFGFWLWAYGGFFFFEIRRGNLTAVQDLIHKGYELTATHVFFLFFLFLADNSTLQSVKMHRVP